MVISKTEAAYCAGIVDADGCISITRSKSAPNRNYNYYENVTVTQVQPQACKLFHKLFGGMLVRSKVSNQNANPIYTWRVSAKNSIACITAITPYLKIKRSSAVNCKRLRQIKNANPNPRGASQPKAVLREMDVLYQLSKRFNARGAKRYAEIVAQNTTAFAGVVLGAR